MKFPKKQRVRPWQIGTPMIRRFRPTDKCNDLRTAFRLATFEQMNKPFYVMVQRGFPDEVMICGLSKKDVKNQILAVSAGWMSYREWRKEIKGKYQ